MESLIKSLQIFSKYFDAKNNFPTHCEHDVLMLCVADKEGDVPEEDKKVLEDLGWHWSDEYECWCSYRFGSC